METLHLTRDEKAALLNFFYDHLRHEKEAYEAAMNDPALRHLIPSWTIHLEHLDTIKAKLHGFKK